MERKYNLMKHQKWPSIESFAHVRKYINESIEKELICQYFNSSYCSKVKLNGTNAAIYIGINNEIIPQKRSSFLLNGEDNCGFAAWVKENETYFKLIRSFIKNNKLLKDEVLVIHGEWFGKGIQKNVACSSINKKAFAVFSIQVKEKENKNCFYIVEPSSIEYCLHSDISPCYVLPYYSFIDINFYDSLSIENAKYEMTKQTIDVENSDPFIKETFNVEGIGEGLVWYPYNKDYLTIQNIEKFVFKTKGSKHQNTTNKSKELIPVDLEKLNSINEFVDKFVTLPRLEQGLFEACNNTFDLKLIGTFLSWMSKDIQKESQEELTLSNFDWKEVNKYLTASCKTWYLNQIKD